MSRLTLFCVVVVLTCCLSQHNVDGHLPKIFDPKNWLKVFTKPSTSIFCRIHHHRVILDRSNNAVSCAPKCPSGYQDKYSLYWGHHCKPHKFPRGCADRYCLTCEPSYYWLYSTTYTKRCVKRCPSGYMTTAEGTCEKCLGRDCHRCTNKWICTKCKGGRALQKYYYQTSTVCVRRCSRGYKRVRKNGVATCVVRNLPEPPMQTTETPTTTEVITDTTTTTDVITDTIIEVIDRTTESPSSTVENKKQSTPKTIAAIKTTEKTDENVPKGCRDHSCSTCLSGYFRFIQQIGGSTCLEQCPVGYSELGTICIPCHDRRCASCKKSIGTCDKCFPGYSMLYDSRNLTSECVRFCPEGHFKKNLREVDVCLKNSEKENLPKGCNDHACITCQPGFFRFILQTGGNTCLEECPGGFKKLETLCVPCHDRRCLSCEQSIGTCDKCFPGYSMLYDSRNLTSECVRFCPEGYSKRNINGVALCTKKTAAECPVANCKKCVSDRLHRLHKGCEECVDRFVLYRATFNDFCVSACPPQHYNVTNEKTNVKYCAKCEVPFCKACTDADTCTECIEPLVIDRVTGKCKVCDAFQQYNFKEKKCVLGDVNRPESSTSDEADPW